MNDELARLREENERLNAKVVRQKAMLRRYNRSHLYMNYIECRKALVEIAKMESHASPNTLSANLVAIAHRGLEREREYIERERNGGRDY